MSLKVWTENLKLRTDFLRSSYLGHFVWHWASQWPGTSASILLHSLSFWSLNLSMAILCWQGYNSEHEYQTSTFFGALGFWPVPGLGHMFWPGSGIWTVIMSGCAESSWCQVHLIFTQVAQNPAGAETRRLSRVLHLESRLCRVQAAMTQAELSLGGAETQQHWLRLHQVQPKFRWWRVSAALSQAVSSLSSKSQMFM